MPAGYSAQCKVCNSPHRAEYESWRKKNMSTRAMAKEALEKFDEKIGYSSFYNHFETHYNVPSEAIEQYYKSQEQIKKDAQPMLSDLEMLDEVIQARYQRHKQADLVMDSILKGERPNLDIASTALIQLYNGTATELCRALKTKQELLGLDPLSRGITSLVDLVTLATDNEGPGEGDS